MNKKHSKTKTSLYRRLYVAHLIDKGFDTVPVLLLKTKMPKRTLQDVIAALHEIDVVVVSSGGTKNCRYSIGSWGFINSEYVEGNIEYMKDVLGF